MDPTSRWPAMFGKVAFVPLTGLVYVDAPCGSIPWRSASQASRCSSADRAAPVASWLDRVPSSAMPIVPEL